MAVTDWGGANSRFLGLVSVGAARSLDQTALRPSVIKIIRQIDVKYITHAKKIIIIKKDVRSKKMRDRSAQKDIYQAH